MEQGLARDCVEVSEVVKWDLVGETVWAVDRQLAHLKLFRPLTLAAWPQLECVENARVRVDLLEGWAREPSRRDDRRPMRSNSYCLPQHLIDELRTNLPGPVLYFNDAEIWPSRDDPGDRYVNLTRPACLYVRQLRVEACLDLRRSPELKLYPVSDRLEDLVATELR
jgi:hypothetical protein